VPAPFHFPAFEEIVGRLRDLGAPRDRTAGEDLGLQVVRSGKK
jgi:hypothetical protein